jgi:ATP-dependent Clp protease ATP-binding subunit ClpA
MSTRRWKPEVTEALTRASQIAKERGHATVGPLHLFYALLVPDAGGAALILRSMGREVAHVRDRLDAALDAVEKPPRPVYEPKPDKAFQAAIDLAETERKVLEEEELNEGHLLIALTSVDGGLDRELRKELGIKRGQIVDALRDVGKAKALASAGGPPEAALTGSMMQFCTDLTGEARSGELDPVIGRERETAQLVEVLGRRRKNNAVLVGEPGVGKTAIVEGLAMAIAKGHVPSVLANTRVLVLDLAAMVAGAKYKGEFEERFKKLIKELEGTAGQGLLFVDELHTLLSAGGGGGGMDAANLLKPALARGTLRMIGATTIGEYRKYIEKDAAFARRFVRIDVAEPDEPICLRILKGVRPKYEEHHKVKIADDALEAAVTLSKRYLPDRFLPDKAVDLLDECASNMKIFTERLAMLRERGKEIDDLKDDDASAPALENWAGVLETLADGLKARGLEAAFDLGDRGKAALAGARGAVLDAAANVPSHVDSGQVGARVSLRTGIPVSKMMGKERERLANIEQYLHERLIGQHDAVRSVANAVRKGRAGLKRPNLPVGSFLFLGPTGTGKTELAKTLAEFLFADEKAMIRFDMSEFQQEHTVQRMIGAPPGYVGYEEGGQLTEAVRRKPYCVLLFDEIEKANKRVFDIFLQVLDDGRLTDGQSRTVDFSNTVVIMTSNMGGLWIAEQDTAGKPIDPTYLRNMLIDEGRGLRPEFVNRFDEFVIFHSLKHEEVRQILELQLKGLRKMLKAQGLSLSVSDPAMTKLAQWSYDPAMGARPVRRTIDQRIINPLSEKIVSAPETAGKTVQVDVAGDELAISVV